MMAGERPTSKEASGAETLLGLQSGLIERTPPLPEPQAERDGPYTYASWAKTRGFSGGRFCLYLAKGLEEESGDALFGRPNAAVSNFTLEGYKEKKSRVEKGLSFESLSAVLGMISTLNRAAEKLDRPLLHVARANKLSLPFFERFREAGLFHYCDQKGEPSEHPVTTRTGTLFACTYPVEGLNSIIGKFAVEETADLFAEAYKRAEARYGPPTGEMEVIRWDDLGPAGPRV